LIINTRFSIIRSEIKHTITLLNIKPRMTFFTVLFAGFLLAFHSKGLDISFRASHKSLLLHNNNMMTVASSCSFVWKSLRPDFSIAIESRKTMYREWKNTMSTWKSFRWAR